MKYTKLANVIDGNIYVSNDGSVGICDGPKPCGGSESGLVVYFYAGGERLAVTSDLSIRPATMREQRDYWRDRALQ